ncbi:Hsp20/alpha crystallin family protein [Halopiger xanaduensis]|uniref:Heat shock protein Hsp20 n=1 Tax=Halopiger xanaduensis (strain DSM 18323 / JCM 14033 / SH-6) TaxID=797210 RepID=F8DC24_HALXS|nr:Hsp20/alpha crystallin family protein [Halopiger xanaduensis]AEH37137.1 heat shock protein Hsp20 [Halopiger xanaduensis SH-6]
MPDRSDPFDSITELFERLSRQLETAARSWETEMDVRDGGRSRFDFSMTQSSPSLDLADEGSEFVVTVDVPGYDTEDLEIRLSGETLSIRGEREHEAEQGGADEQYIRRERAVQSFNRQLQLPDPVEVDDVSATVNNGILTVRLPKREPSDESTSIDID